MLKSIAALLVAGACACGSGSDPVVDRLSARFEQDRPDVTDEPQVHVLYVLASDSTDRQLDRNGVLAGSLTSGNRWLEERTGVALRIDQAAGEVDVTFVRMRPDEQRLFSRGNRIRDAIEVELGELGVLASNKLYVAFYEGVATHACADAPVPPDLVGRVTVVYLNGVIPAARPCADNPIAKADGPAGYIELATLHEVMHALGAVPRCAPHWVSNHVGDRPEDLMYAGSAPWRPSVVDVANDDYWGHGRGDCTDVSRSALLVPTPVEPQLPAGW